ncbi:hypothetical protein BDZ45DRAFT_664575 [Acephala macrosclerotiorum]|nr:hypothetical protein BDZ45DRAFT_664575 [Acephala macrosclerotiorum]
MWLRRRAPLSGGSPNCPPAPIELRLGNGTIAGTNVDSRGFLAGLSTPAQFLFLAPSTVVNSTIVISDSFCTNSDNLTTAQCASSCGNTYNISAAGDSFKSTPNTLMISDPVWASISSQPLYSLTAGETLLQLPSGQALSNDSIGIISSGENQNMGHLGLASNSSFLQLAISTNLIPGNGFGFDAGSQSITNPRDGGLVLGGYNPASIGGQLFTFPTGASSSLARECPLQVNVTQLAIRFPGVSADVPLTSAGGFAACVEMYDNLFRFTQNLLQNFQAVTDWSSNTTADPNIYRVEPGLLFPSTNPFNGSLIITIDGGKLGPLTVTIPNEEMSNPLRGISANGGWVLQSNVTEASIFFQSARLNTPVLPKAFLSQLYLIVNWDAKQFQLATLAPTSEQTSSNLVAFNSVSTPATCANPEISGLASYSWVKSWVEPTVIFLAVVEFIVIWHLFGKYIRQGLSSVKQNLSSVGKKIRRRPLPLIRKKTRGQPSSPNSHVFSHTAAQGNEDRGLQNPASSTEPVEQLTGAPQISNLFMPTAGLSNSDEHPVEELTNTTSPLGVQRRSLSGNFGSGNTPNPTIAASSLYET